MGESTSDFLVHRACHRPPSLIGAAASAPRCALQLRAGRYSAWIYWLAVAMVGVFGTMAADVLHVGLGIPYIVSTAFYAVALTAVFVTWQRSEVTLSIHSILTPRRELFYWAAVLATFALGTAAGDMTALHAAAGLPRQRAVVRRADRRSRGGYRRFGLNAILAFWFAYIVTRPLGASFADWLAVPHSRGGLGFGYGPVASCWPSRSWASSPTWRAAASTSLRSRRPASSATSGSSVRRGRGRGRSGR